MSGIRTIAFLLIIIAGSLQARGQAAGTNAIQSIFIGQPIPPAQAGQWVETEGTVTFAGKQGDKINLELSSQAGHMQISVAGADEGFAQLLPGSRIRAKGICIATHGIDGEVVGSLAIADPQDITILQMPQESWYKYPLRSISELTNGDLSGQIVHLHGWLWKTQAGDFRLGDTTGEVKVDSTQPLSRAIGTEVEILGEWEGAGTVRNDFFRAASTGKNEPAALQVLNTTEQVRWLRPDEAERRYPVKLRAVVTFVLATQDGVAGNLQDGSGGIYAWNLVASTPRAAVKPGDFCEIEGDTSAGAFSPGIYCHRLKVLGPGEFPEPARPTWNELASGSLDAQWVELEGIVLTTTNQHLEIGAQGGDISCFVPDGSSLGHLSNAVVRVRGVVVADWDSSRHVTGLHLNLPSEGFIWLETPPLDDPFSLQAKQIKDLLFYDPGESGFRREKITGQIIGTHGGVYYLTDGTNGLRLIPKNNPELAAGETVEAVGFPEIDNSTAPPVLALRDAIVRVTGTKPMPPPSKISSSDLLNSEYDSTRVQLDADLIHSEVYGADQVLELETGARTVFARLSVTAGRLPQLPAGSRVELTGAYVLNNGRANTLTGPFELLLNSPADLKVLALPTWWTSEHAIMVVSGMTVVMVLGLVWISILRQQVERRTAQLSTANRSLEAEIAERKRTENELVQTRLEHLVEVERTRIARDIHDELGSSLSQIRLLSEMALSQKDLSSETSFSAGKISAKALEATNVLDEIVWAVDPQNDTLESLLNYLFNFASDFLSLAGVRFRIDAPTQIPPYHLTTQTRHQLYMAFKETLTNIANHAKATEVWIRLVLEKNSAYFIVEDNGCGFDLLDATVESPGANGLKNMRTRFNEIGGEFTLESAPGKGTRVRFRLPLNGKL